MEHVILYHQRLLVFGDFYGVIKRYIGQVGNETTKPRNPMVYKPHSFLVRLVTLVPKMPKKVL